MRLIRGKLSAGYLGPWKLASAGKKDSFEKVDGTLVHRWQGCVSVPSCRSVEDCGSAQTVDGFFEFQMKLRTKEGASGPIRRLQFLLYCPCSRVTITY